MRLGRTAALGGAVRARERAGTLAVHPDPDDRAVHPDVEGGVVLDASRPGDVGVIEVKLALTFQDDTITAKIDGATVDDTGYGSGLVGLGAADYDPVQYSNLSITSGTVPDRSGTYRIVNVSSGKALDASDGGTTDGTPIVQWFTNGGSNQRWKLVKIT